MKVVIEVSGEAHGRPPAGSPVRVELRDTSLADAPAVILASASAAVADEGHGLLARVDLDVDAVPRGATVWVHVDVDRSGRVSVGDYITKSSFPVPESPSAPVRVTVSRV